MKKGVWIKMKIDLCKLLGVEEGEEFTRDDSKIYYKYRVYNNRIQHFDEVLKIWDYSTLTVNALVTSEIIKLPKKKQFTDDELCILRNIDKEYKWIARDKRNTLYVYKENEPFTTGTVWNNHSDNYARFPYDDIFKSISWEDIKPTYIDDYVDRN